jgi:GNAT superfamily N-acetyltransferase
VVVSPPVARGGVGHLVLQVNRHPVGDIDLALCGPCQVGLIHHLRVDPEHRRRGYGRALLAAALARGPAYRWSTTAVDDTAVARAFWAAVADPGLHLGHPSPCSDMRSAAGMVE